MFIKQLHKESEKQARSGKRHLQYVNNKEFIYIIYIYITTNHFLEKQKRQTTSKKMGKRLEQALPKRRNLHDQ